MKGFGKGNTPHPHSSSGVNFLGLVADDLVSGDETSRTIPRGNVVTIGSGRKGSATHNHIAEGSTDQRETSGDIAPFRSKAGAKASRMCPSVTS